MRFADCHCEFAHPDVFDAGALGSGDGHGVVRDHRAHEVVVGLQDELREVGGQVGTGGLAVAEGANAVSRLKAIRPDGDFDRRVLHAFSTLFTKLDTRIADVIDAGIKPSMALPA